jgi:hypothetical protein
VLWVTDKLFHKLRLYLQYWPKVTHAMKRASHVGCNACNARIHRVLHRIWHSNVAHMKRASSVQHPGNIHIIFRFMTRLLRLCRPFMYCRCLALLACRKCAGPWVTFGQYCNEISRSGKAYILLGSQWTVRCSVEPNSRFAWSQSFESFVNMAPGPAFLRLKIGSGFKIAGLT